MADEDGSSSHAVSKTGCKHCKKSVVHAVKCKKCNLIFHPRCLIQAAQAKSAVCRHEVQNDASKDSSDSECETDEDNENRDKLLERYIAENKLLRELVKELESKCDILNENCSLLKEKITFVTEKQVSSTKNLGSCKNPNTNQGQTPSINQSIPVNNSAPEVAATKRTFSTVAKFAHPESKLQQNVNSIINKNKNHQTIFTTEDVCAAVSNAQSANKLNELQNLGNEDEEHWEKVEPRRSRNNNRRFVVGRNDENTGISTVAKLVSLHVTRLHPTTKPDDLKKILINNFPEGSCKSHMSKHPELYASMKITYKCCKSKPFIHYVCIQCHSIFHKSCLLANKKKITMVEGNQIICCKREPNDQDEQTSILEKTINDLSEDSEMKNNYIEKLKKEKNIYIQQAIDMELEINTLLADHKKTIEELEDKIKDLEKIAHESVKPTKSICTQTRLVMSHKATTTDLQTREQASGDNEPMEKGMETDRGVGKCPKLNSQHRIESSSGAISKSSTSNESTNHNRKILLASNYHGRCLASYLSHQNENKYLSIQSIMKPKAHEDEVLNTAMTNTKAFTKNDLLFIWLHRHEMNTEKLEQFAINMAHTNTIFITEPYNYNTWRGNQYTYENNLFLSKTLHKYQNSVKVFECNNYLNGTHFFQRSNKLKNRGIYILGKALTGYISDPSTKLKKLNGKYTVNNISNDKKETTSNNAPLHSTYMYPRLSQVAPSSDEHETYPLNEGKKETASENAPLHSTHNMYPRLSQVAPSSDEQKILDESELPSIQNFYNKLNDTNISDDDYAHARKVWESFELKSLGEYSDLYMRTDILLLADVMENFRASSLKTYGLDPAWYYTMPGYTWDCMLKYTGCKLQIIKDIDMVMFVEQAIRGGVSVCCNRYGREDEEVMGLKFCNEAIMCLVQLYPPHPGIPQDVTPLQSGELQLINGIASFYEAIHIIELEKHFRSVDLIGTLLSDSIFLHASVLQSTPTQDHQVHKSSTNTSIGNNA
ncbi:unnamed protein product [Phaedon cochleariae]|uniref:Phorbol-ester/DAG-type domain-containing protein n=1 Tax=Phaedon cochleariae TaxID=80249 RepID=A0A9N9SCR3_PHACE|nr:unnamed protein product [Phaedon cochleariae]